MSASPQEGKCDRCEKTVYALERCTVDTIEGRIWHQHCFKCHVCNSTIPKGKGEGYNELGVVFCKYHYPKLTPSMMAEWLRRLGRHAEAEAFERRLQDELDQKRRDEEARKRAAEEAKRAAEEAARQRAADELARKEALRPAPVSVPSINSVGSPTLRTLAEQGAIVKAADKAVREEKGLPKELSPKIQDDLEKAAIFGVMCSELANSPNRPLAAVLSKGANEMGKAVKDLADKSNKFFQSYLEPRPAERDAIDNATREIDRIVDEVLGQVSPPALRPPESSYPAGRVPTALSLREQGELVKRADAQLRNDLGNGTPKTVSADAQDAGDKGATFADMAGRYGDSAGNPSIKDLMREGAREMEGATKKLIGDTQRHLDDPTVQSETPVRADTKQMDDIVDRLLGELFPAFLQYPAHLTDSALGPVTPDDLRKQGELVKKADKKVRDDIGQVTPRQLASDAEDAVAKAGKFADIAAKLGRETPNKAMADLLRNGAVDVDRAKDRVVDRANDLLKNPDDANAKRALEDATRVVDDLVDRILGDTVPKAVVMPTHQLVNANPNDLHAQAQRVKVADKKVRDDIPFVTPKALSDDVTDAAKEAVLFGDMANSVGDKSHNPALRDAIRRGADKLNDAVRDLVDGTNSFVDPASRGNESGVVKPTKDIDDAVDAIMAEIFPSPIRNPLSSHNLGRVTPDDLRRQGALVKEADKKVRDDTDKVTPRDLGKEAADAAEKADKFGEMAKALGRDTPNRGLADLLKQGGDDVGRAKDALVDAANNYLKNPESEPAKRGLADATKRLDDLVDRILGDLAPGAVKYPTPKNINATPNDLKKQGELVKAADKKVRDDIPHVPPKTLADDVQDTADKAQVFGDMANDLADKTSNPALRDALKKATGQLLDPAVKDLVDGANQFVDPSTHTPESAVTTPTKNIDKAVDTILDEIFPPALAPLFGLDNLGDVTPDDLRKQGAEVKKADEKVRNDTDKVTPKTLGKEAGDAAEKADKFGRMADKLGDKMPAAFGKPLKDGAKDMDRAKDDLVDAANDYLRNPESAPAKKRLADATRAIDDLVDKILDDAQPKKLVHMPNLSHFGPVRPTDLLDQCKKVKAEDAKTRDALGVSPPLPFADQVQKNADEAGKLAGMADKLAPTAPTPALRRDLEEAAKDLVPAITDLMNSANNVIQNPASGAEPAVERATKKIDDIVDKLTGLAKKYQDEEDRIRREKEAADEAERQRRLAEEMAARARMAGFKPKSMDCYTCKQTIPIGETHARVEELDAEKGGRPYHNRCFQCGNCRRPLTNGYHIQGDYVLCESCSAPMTCEICRKPILHGENYCTKSFGALHAECFKCDVCGTPIGHVRHFMVNERVGVCSQEHGDKWYDTQGLS